VSRENSIQLPLPKNVPKSFKEIERNLENLFTKLDSYRDKNPKVFNEFFDDIESLYLESMSLDGEHKRILQSITYFVWGQMMTILKHGDFRNE